MNSLKHLLLLFVMIITVVSCTVKPAKINYGEDHCNYCDMTIVDKTHVSEYVTKKGKSFKFDAIECMTHEINQKNNLNNLAYVLVANFNKPGKLIDARNATYLVSKAIKSPMGANLSAFNSKEQGLDAQKKYGGKLYNWSQIRKKLGTK